MVKLKYIIVVKMCNFNHYPEVSHPLHIYNGLVLHGAEMSAGIFQQSTKDEGETDAEIDVDSFNEAVGIGKRGPGTHH